MIPPKISKNLKWYNPLKRWLMGVHSKMPVFIDRNYNGYIVTVRPRDRCRKFIRFKQWYWLPYLDGSVMWMTLKIEPAKTLPANKEIKYEWRFKRLSDNQLFGHKEVIATTLPSEPIEVVSDLILDSTKYVLELKLDELGSENKEEKFQVIAVFTVQDRDDFYSQFVWFFAGAIVLFFGTLLGFLLS